MQQPPPDAGGLESTTLSTWTVQELAEGCCLARATWLMRFQRDGHELESENLATYVVHRIAESWEIVLQLDHQDLMCIAPRSQACADHRVE
jgi:hypothetical protein